MITQNVFHYDFSHVKWNPPDWRNESFDRFLMLFRAKPQELEGTLISHYAGFSVYVADSAAMTPEWRHRQNYSAYCPPDSPGRILEASLKTAEESQPYKVGFPLSLIENPEEEHEFAVMFDGVRYQIFCDGAEMDREFPGGRPRHFYHDDIRCIKKSMAFEQYRFANDLSGVRREVRQVQSDAPVQFYTPFGSNTWLGDVVIHEYKGVFHLFYLFDRRHHGARNGKGMHEFWHMSTENFVDWTDHGPLFEITEQWQAVGTGNAFIFQDRLHLSFGWHTERNAPTYRTASTLFIRNLEKYGHTGELLYDELGELLPGGASYLTSEDGISFTPSRRLMHYLVNPCIFVQPDGSLKMVQRGVWESGHLGDWKRIDKNFPPWGDESFARNCLDCPAIFEIGGWEYCMVGFTALFGRKSGSGRWQDMVQQGIDIYDGTNVPMVAWDKKHRLIEAGWLGGIGWGSCLLMREIIALGDGRLGKRWLPETLPVFGQGEEFSRISGLAERGDFLFEFEVEPQDGDFAVVFSGRGVSCEFRLNPASGRGQWAEAGKTVPSYREDLIAHPEYDHFDRSPYAPKNGRDYARENLSCPDKPFTVRILLHNDPKLNASVLDAEIAGIHTMATMRRDLVVSGASTANRKSTIRRKAGDA